MATNAYILGFFLLLAVGSGTLPVGYFLERRNSSFYKAPSAAQLQLIQIAQSQLGVRELSGKNDGPEVEAYLASAQLAKGQAWCAAFISWVFANAGYVEPRTGWSPALFPIAKRIPKPEPAAVLGIYFPELKRIAHVGLVEKVEGSWIISIEGNTNLTGSREGDGVYRKRRLAKSINQYANWLPVEKGALR